MREFLDALEESVQGHGNSLLHEPVRFRSGFIQRAGNRVISYGREAVRHELAS
ncbi:hypothetical protein D3C85_1814320 [compost metagenome]